MSSEYLQQLFSLEGQVAVVIGGTGAYSESMSPENYNSHRKPGAVMKTRGGELVQIRKKQVREQIYQNELDVKL